MAPVNRTFRSCEHLVYRQDKSSLEHFPIYFLEKNTAIFVPVNILI